MWCNWLTLRILVPSFWVRVPTPQQERETCSNFGVTFKFWLLIKKNCFPLFGELSEWSIEVVLKTIDRVERSGGSNPSLSANSELLMGRKGSIREIRGAASTKRVQ